MSKDKINTDNWVDEYSDYLFRFAITRVSDEEKAKDLVQDTFFSALKAYDKFEHKSSIKTWLTSILKRKIYDFYRVKDREVNVSKLAYFSDNQSNEQWVESKQPKGFDFADKDLEQSELLQTLLACIANLPAKAASVFKLKNLQNYDSEQICKDLGISKSNYWVLTHRARLQMRECMESKWYKS